MSAQGGFSPELELLYQAMGSPLGLAVKVSDFLNARARLYAARAQSGDPDLSRLRLQRSLMMEEDVIWIVKGPAPAEDSAP